MNQVPCMDTVMSEPHPILIAGPTASGKSALALEYARTRNGVIINADSMQVYTDLRILSARPSMEEEAAAPHSMYGHVDGAEVYSVARWLEDVKRALGDARHAGQTPIIVGGTGLYFKALLEGLSPVPDIPDAIRGKWRDFGERGGPALHAELSRLDPDMAAQLRPSDRQRLIRALEVLEATGRSLLDWQKLPGTPLVDVTRCERRVVLPDRDVLYDRCNRRFELMLELDALAEVEALVGRGLPESLPVMGALGVRPLAAMLRDELSREDAIAQSQQDTRRYAKRQMTWARNQMADWDVVEG